MMVIQQCQNLKERKINNILITSIGKRVSLLKAFDRELKLIYPTSNVYAADSNTKLSAASYISCKSFNLPLINSPKYIPELIKICKLNSIKIIIPTIDTELLKLSRNSKFFIKEGIIPVISSEELVKICRNKRELHKLLLNKNINVAKEYDKKKYNLPLFIKPIDGSRSQDNYIINNQSEFKEYHFNNENLMFLEYINTNIFSEYTCDLYYNRDHYLKCVIPRKRIDVRDGEVNKGKTEENSLIKFLYDKLSYLEGAIGCLTAQFFKSNNNDEIIGIEINPRFGGGYPLSYAAGANFPKWIIEEYLLKKQIKRFDSWEKNLLMLRYDKEVLVSDFDE